MNTFGRYLRLTTFGESHGPCVGGVIDGCPAGIKIDFDFIYQVLARRKSAGGTGTDRKEEDSPEFISGLLEGVTTGTPLAFIIKNKNTRSADYDHLRDVFRPSHADFTYQSKYGIRDSRGGGRSSARETVVRVVAGAIALQILQDKGVQVFAYTSQLGVVGMEKGYYLDGLDGHTDTTLVGCPLPEIDRQMYQGLLSARNNGDTLGGIASVVVSGVPTGLGSPLYAKLDARLAEAMLSINACKGIEFGSGFDMASMSGSRANDELVVRDGKVVMSTNHSGGVLGGISTGDPILFRVVFKPIASIATPQKTVDINGNEVELEIHGRHDASVFPRVLPIVESMTAMVLLDEILADRTVRMSEL